MKKIAIGITAVTALIGTSVSASAQSTESQSTNDILRRLQTLEASNAALAKENAALRVENTKLQGRVREQKGSNETAQQTSTTSASALSRTSSKAALYDKASSPMVVKAPPVAPIPVWSWTGCYAGVNGGYAWNTGNTHYDDPNTTGDPINFIRFAGLNNTWVAAPSNRLAGGLGGFGVGCNWQSQQWVYGVEADADVGHIAGSHTNFAGGIPGFSQITVAPDGLTLTSAHATATETTEINWLSTIRGRVGFTVLDRLLLFATGGLAIGQVHSEGSVTAGSVSPLTLQPSSFEIIWSGSHSEVKAGFVVGGGAEWAFADRWTAKAEYLWYDLGDVSHPLACTSGVVAVSSATIFTCIGAPASPLYPTLGNAVSALQGSIVRVGINYRFN